MDLKSRLTIIAESDELLVVNKPAGLVCHPTKTDEYSSLISRARLYLGPESHPQLINRLDRETSGVTLIAKTSMAAREVRRLWENRQVAKEYAAVVHGHVAEDHGTIDAPLGKDERSQVAIKDCVRADGQPASTRFRVTQRFKRPGPDGTPAAFSLLLVRPETGRKHQIRIHLAHSGHPIVGDKLYGGDEDLYLALVENRLTVEQQKKLLLPHHALHAGRVQFAWRSQDWMFEAKPEAWFLAFVNGK